MYTDLALYIDGEWKSGGGRKGEDVVNPATEQSIRNALGAMKNMRFLKEPPLTMPMEKGL